MTNQLDEQELREANAAKLIEWLEGLPVNYREISFETWERRPAFLDPVRRCVEYAEAFPFGPIPSKFGSLLLCGDNGVGKTHLACAIAKVVMRRGLEGGLRWSPVRYVQGYRLIEEVQRTYAPSWDGPSKADVLKQYRGSRLLILDDVGDPAKEPATDHTRTVYFNLIDQRYSDGLPVVVVSNRQGKELRDFFGPATYDRLNEMAPEPVILQGRSWREILAERARKHG